jgi:hypothetical protein
MAGALLLTAVRRRWAMRGMWGMRGLWWGAAALLLISDLWVFGIAYNTSVPAKDYYPPTELTDQLRALPPDQPIIAQGADLFPSCALVYGIHDFRTLDDAVNHRFTFFITDASVQTSMNPVWQAFGLVSRPNAAMLAQVGVRYFAAEPRLDPNRGQPKGPKGRPYALKWQGHQANQVASEKAGVGRDKSAPSGVDGPSIWENIYTVPYAYFPARDEVVKTEEADRARMRKIKYADVGQVAILEAAEGQGDLPTTGKGRVTRVVREPGHITVDVVVDGPRPAPLVLNESFEDGWRARIDGTRARIYPANYLVQAVVVLPGKHTVVLDYKPPPLLLGALCSLAALALCALVLALPGLLKRRGRRDAGPVV